MPRLVTLSLLVLTALTLHYRFEALGARRDQEAMKHAYDSFLAQKVRGFPLSEHIREDGVSVFQSTKGTIVCGIAK